LHNKSVDVFALGMTAFRMMCLWAPKGRDRVIS